ncbi:polyketide synthase [Streptomyces hilarionis]|uniref:beta-ketoacyl [acyl carrier protein] synthase domain-containing protein n=1 Tax=Streptomyces hilarionis TaxID=2839954 RepID=UPI00211A07DE|nr:polyketide synthase [Streptomyces hilarionis]MCQ9131373.1 polyketide synthase [Streptomyces hilarionis]
MTSYIDHLETLSRKQLMVMLARQHHERTQPVAVVGMGCRLPGGLDDPDELWNALREGRVLPTESAGVPEDSLGRPRWNLAAPDLAPLAGRLRQGAYLTDVDLFDADRFGIGAQEARDMDPQQRLLLEVAAQALADANLSRQRLRGRTTGVYAVAGPVEYPHAWLRGGRPGDGLSAHMSTGSSPSAFSGRIALSLGLDGPAVTVDTASSSMLTAVHLAVRALRARECDIALVGTCNLLLSPFGTGILDRAGMLSPTGRSRPFTRHADGHVRGEGCGVVVLKRYADAIADGDRPYALVRGSAVHAQGDRPGISVAPARGQRTVIERALQDADVAPEDVQYVEAQANGSRIGGQIEAEALADAYARRSPDAPPLYVGSCKANLGYLETASGAPGLMKTVLALAHAEIPPQPGEDEPDPDIPWGRTALRLAAKPQPWPTRGRRRAAVSGFGFCGTLAHVVLESVPERPAAAESGPAGTGEGAGPWPLLLSAHTAEALARTAARLHRHLRRRADWTPAAVCRTLAEGRDHLAARYAAVVHDRAGLLAALERAAAAGQEPGLDDAHDAHDADGAPGRAADAVRHARRHIAGEAPATDEWWTAEAPRPDLLHLPGPALVGRRHWPDHHNWI